MRSFKVATEKKRFRHRDAKSCESKRKCCQTRNLSHSRESCCW